LCRRCDDLTWHEKSAQLRTGCYHAEVVLRGWQLRHPGHKGAFMSSPFVDASYLAYQYDDSEKLRIRLETHQRYTVGGAGFTTATLRHVDARPGLCILDVGCGPGWLARSLRGLDVTYVGLDRSLGLVKEARGKHEPGIASVSFIQGDAQALPIADGCVD